MSFGERCLTVGLLGAKGSEGASTTSGANDRLKVLRPNAGRQISKVSLYFG